VGNEKIREAEFLLKVFEEVDDLGLDGDVEADTGSSATTSCGRSANALAMPILWRCPPENSWDSAACGPR